jgi:glycosyltransferase involved in cell wall biosynthesis
MIEPRLHVVQVLEASLGGTRRYLENIIEASAGSDQRMTFIYSGRRADSAFAQTLALARESGWDMRRAVGFHDLRDALALRRMLARLQPDIVHAHSSKAGALVRLAVLGLRKRPRVLYSPHALAESKIYLAIERFLARIVPTTFVAASESEQAQLRKIGFASPEDIRFAYPSVDIGYFRPRNRDRARARLGLPLNVPLVLGVARLVDQKNPLDFLRVVTRVRERYPSLCVVWVGGGDLEERFTAEIARLGIEDVVHRLPWSEDIRDAIAACDVFLSTARFESFGYVVAEAMSMERLAIASAVIGTNDVLDADWAEMTFPAGDVARAVSLVNRVLAKTPNAERCRAARLSIAKRFSNARLGAALDSRYTRKASKARAAVATRDSATG